MKFLVPAGLAVLLAVSLLFLFRARTSRRATSAPRPDIYNGLRAQILGGSRSGFELQPTSVPTEPWGVLMDWGVPTGTATVVALSGGNASVYLSSGGGFIGGSQSHESIRRAAQNAVAIAADFQPQMRATSGYPLPGRGEVVFYLLTDAGVFTASGSEEDLSRRNRSLSRLGNAMQAIVTEYRRTQ